MNQATYLIVDQQQQAPDNLPELLKDLAQNHQLDSYQCRQRLIGRGLSLLTKGQKEPLQKISTRLQEAGYTHWLVEPSKPQYVPKRLRELQITAEKITFICQKEQVIIPKGATLLAVFADMSGKLAEKNVTQLLSSHAYRGRDNVRHLEKHKIHKTILQGRPLLDIYLLDKTKQISNAVRIFPGKFDSKGLGDRATLSSVQNLERVLQLAEEYSDDFNLATDFGLVNLPGCTLRPGNLDDLEIQRQNQLSLVRYGWLLADLQRVGPVIPAPAEENDDLTAAATAAVLLQNPALTADPQAADLLPVIQEVTRELQDRGENKPKIKISAAEKSSQGLPAPPPAIKNSVWKKPGFWLGSAGAGVVFLGTLLLQDNSRSVLNILRLAIGTGAAPFLLSALLFWSSFYFLRLKRQVENTPTSKIRSVAMGMVEVKGRAIRQYALVSPMSHAPCVFYRLTKYRREQNNQWRVTSVSSSNQVPFLLEDDTGKVEIDPAGCRVNAGTKQEGIPGQVGLVHFSNDSDDKWVEEIIVEGTLLYILGFAAVKKPTGPSLSERKIEALRELKQNPQQLQQYDSDGDGNISTDEWDAARAAVEEKVHHEELQKKQHRKKQEEHIVIGKRKSRPMIIAETHSEDHLTRRFALYTVPLFIAAAGTTGWGIYALLSYLK